MLTYFYEKCSQLKKYLVRLTLLHIFADFFTIWLTRRQLGFHICHCSQSVVMSYFYKTSLYAYEKGK